MNISVFGFIVGSAVLAATAPPSSSLDDPKILGVVDVANTAQIEQAELALSRTQAPAVKAFARATIEDHTDAREEGRSVAKRLGVALTPSPTSNDLKEANSQIIIQLRPLQKNRFDRAYIDSQVTFGKRVLSLIDERLLPDAQASEVKSLLSGIRGHVEEHLDKAEKILEKLPNKP